jgi:hypothetical protein
VVSPEPLQQGLHAGVKALGRKTLGGAALFFGRQIAPEPGRFEVLQGCGQAGGTLNREKKTGG